MIINAFYTRDGLQILLLNKKKKKPVRGGRASVDCRINVDLEFNLVSRKLCLREISLQWTRFKWLPTSENT